MHSYTLNLQYAVSRSSCKLLDNTLSVVIALEALHRVRVDVGGLQR